MRKLDVKEAAGTINTVRALLARLPPLCCQTLWVRGNKHRRGGEAILYPASGLKQQDTFGEPLLQDPTKLKCTPQATRLGEV